MPEIRTHLQRIRKQSGLGATELAQRVGIARQTIYAIERGSFVPNTAVALQLARALEVSVEDLFDLEPSVEAPTNHVAAEPVDETAPGLPGQLVQLCKVGQKLVAAPARVSPSWLPRSNAVIAARLSARSLRVDTISPPAEFNRDLVIAGCDPAIAVLSNRLAESEGIGLAAVECSSRRALEWLKAGKIHIAGSHLRDAHTGEYNLPFVRHLFPRGGFRVVTYATWEQGLVVAAGNPRGIHSVSDLARSDVSLINREAGAGSRDLLDRLLHQAGVSSDRVHGYARIASGHLAAAQTVLAGDADACVATSLAARVLGLDFIPLAVERYDFVTLERFSETPPVRSLFDALSRSRLRRELQVLAGYDTARTGEIRA